MPFPQAGLVRLLVVCVCMQTFLSCATPVRKPEKTPDRNLLVGNQYAKDGLLREAAQAYRRVLLRNQHHPAAHRNLGIVLVKSGDYKKAVRHLRKSLVRYKTDYRTNYYLGEALRVTGQYGRAIFHYNQALDIKRRDVKTLKALAWSYYKIRYYTEALKTVRQIRKVQPSDTQASIIAGRTYIKLGSYKRALAVIRKGQALARKGDLPHLQSVEGDAYAMMGKCDKAKKVYRLALKEQTLLAGSLFGLGRCMLQTGENIEKALSYTERALRLKPDLAEVYYVLGKHFESKEPKKAARYFRLFRKHAHNDPEFLNEVREVRAWLKSSRPAKKGSYKGKIDKLETHL